MEALFGDDTEVREAHPLRRVALRICYGLEFVVFAAVTPCIQLGI
jgi:hypothetical protein